MSCVGRVGVVTFITPKDWSGRRPPKVIDIQRAVHVPPITISAEVKVSSEATERETRTRQYGASWTMSLEQVPKCRR